MLEFHETDFLRAFRLQIGKITIELDMMRNKMDETLIKYQHDKKLKALEKQVEYFRSQALRLKSEREGNLEITRICPKN